MNSLAKFISISVLSLAVSSKSISKPSYGSGCLGHVHGKCIPCSPDVYWDEQCHNNPGYHASGDPYKKLRSLIGIGLGINLGDLLDIDLGVDVGKFNKLLDASVNSNALKQ